MLARDSCVCGTDTHVHIFNLYPGYKNVWIHAFLPAVAIHSQMEWPKVIITKVRWVGRRWDRLERERVKRERADDLEKPGQRKASRFSFHIMPLSKKARLFFEERLLNKMRREEKRKNGSDVVVAVFKNISKDEKLVIHTLAHTFPFQNRLKTLMSKEKKRL